MIDRIVCSKNKVSSKNGTDYYKYTFKYINDKTEKDKEKEKEKDKEKEVTDEPTLNRIKKLVIPPQWKSVKISDDPTDYLQVSGIDKNGKTQYIYHPLFISLLSNIIFPHWLNTLSSKAFI